MISTRDLSKLPDIDTFRRLLQSMAMLDAILSPQWEFRYYSFNSKWSRGKQMGSIRNGCGDDFFALFNKHGCWLKGFAHEAVMSPYREDGTKAIWPGVLDAVPAEFADCLTQPAFSVEDTTFCIWRRYSDAEWQRGEIKFPPRQKDSDGSAQLLSPLDGKPRTYLAWATDYFRKGDGGGRALYIEHVRHIYSHKPLSAELVAEINPNLTLKELAGDVKEIGYPAKGSKK
jgi:hypothetical protein